MFASASSFYTPFSDRSLCVDYEMSMCGLPIRGVTHLFGVCHLPEVRSFDRTGELLHVILNNRDYELKKSIRSICSLSNGS